MPVLTKPKFSLTVTCPHCTAEVRYDEIYCIKNAYPYEPDVKQQRIYVSCQNCALPIIFEDMKLIEDSVSPAIIEGLREEVALNIRCHEQKQSIKAACLGREFYDIFFDITRELHRQGLDIYGSNLKTTVKEAW